MKFNYSKKFIEKHGEVVISRKNELFQEQLIPTAWYIDVYKYMIDWKTRKKVHLVNWLKEQVDSELVQDIVKTKKWNAYEYGSDETMFSIFRFICGRYEYHGDPELWDAKERWATIQESLEEKNGKGDCEDGAIAMLVLARAAGIPEERIKLVVGNVKGGGHAWVTYIADDGVVYCMDWCYWKSYRAFATRKSLYQQPNYFYGQKIWFGVNDISKYS